MTIVRGRNLITTSNVTDTVVDTFSVYVHTNIANGKKYFGITFNEVEQRWGANGVRYKTQSYFYRAIKKYGWDGFDHEVIASRLTSEEAQQMEINLIAEYKTTNRLHGYNSTSGGEHGIHNNEAKARMSVAQIGKRLTPETKAKIREARVGRKQAPEAKAKVSAFRKGREATPETRINMSASAKSRKATPEAKKNMSVAMLGRNIGKKRTLETRLKMSTSAKLRRATPETRAKMSAGQKESRRLKKLAIKEKNDE